MAPIVEGETPEGDCELSEDCPVVVGKDLESVRVVRVVKVVADAPTTCVRVCVTVIASMDDVERGAAYGKVAIISFGDPAHCPAHELFSSEKCITRKLQHRC